MRQLSRRLLSPQVVEAGWVPHDVAKLSLTQAAKPTAEYAAQTAGKRRRRSTPRTAISLGRVVRWLR